MSEENSEQFSLRWNNFFSNLTSGFHSLWQEKDFVDVTLAADGKFVQAHKVVLSVCSPYFMRLFKVNPCKHPIVILKDVGYNELSGLLQFMYRGEVNVYQEELPNFLKTAELLQIKGLTSSDAQTASSKNENSSVLLSNDKRTSIPEVNDANITPGKRKHPEFDQPTSEISETIGQESELGPLQIPVLPQLNPIDFEESECSEISSIKDPLACLFEGDSSRPVTNKPATFRVTARGRLQLVQNNYVYHCNRQKDNKIFWKCAEYNRTGCRGRCISIGWAVTVTHALHNHRPESMREDSRLVTDLAEIRQTTTRQPGPNNGFNNN